MREIRIEGYLVECIEALGGECRKWTDPGRRGAPDRICFLPGGVIVFVETKAKRGKLRTNQKRYHAMLRRLRQRVVVLYSIEQVDDFLLTV